MIITITFLSAAYAVSTSILLLQVFQQFDRREKVVEIDVVVLVLQRGCEATRASLVWLLSLYPCIHL